MMKRISHKLNPVYRILMWCAHVWLASQAAFAQSNATRLDYTLIDGAQFPVVVSHVTLWGPDGLSVGGLTQNDFSVYEDGVLQTPIFVEGFGSDSGGVSVVLVMDRSGSMEEEIDDAKAAAVTFVSYMSDFDQAALVTFNRDVTVDLNFTNDRAALTDAINAIVLGDGTAVYDATMTALDLLSNVSGKRAIVLMTDGRDNSSSTRFNDLIQRLSGGDIPVLAIGLGLKSDEVRDLQGIADASQGRFYDSPTSSQLEEIYRAIAYLLLRQKWYRITYTTSNCMADGTTRQVRIEARYNGQTASATNSYVAPGHYATMAFAADSLPMPGKSFRLRLEIPSQSPDVLGLFELDVVLKYDSRYLQVRQPVDQNVQIGPLFGSPAEYTFTTNSTTAGELGLQVKRKAGFGRITGRGVIAEITFVASSAMPDSTALLFEIATFAGRNDAGCGVALQSQNLTLYSYGLMVWPGDTNHNGTVELTDVTVLGIHWEINGPPRTGPEDQNSWMAHLAGKFAKVAATHADANGTGRIDERDLFPIGLNWRKTAVNPEGLPKPQSDAPEGEIVVDALSGNRSGEHRIRMRFVNHNGADLAGLAFRLDYPERADIVSVHAGEVWGKDLLRIENNDRQRRVFAMAMIIPGGEAAQSKEGSLVELVVSTGASLDFAQMKFHSLAVVSPTGEMRELQDPTLTQSSSAPQRFLLHSVYPNPLAPNSEATPATIRFDLPEDAEVTLKIYNIAGQKVREVALGAIKAGRHDLKWDGRSDTSSHFGSGTYLIKVSAVGKNSRIYAATQKVTVVR